MSTISWPAVMRTPSAMALIVANVAPLIGVLIFDWSTFEIVFLYWLENVVLGMLNVVKMATCSPDPEYALLSKNTVERISDHLSENSNADKAKLLKEMVNSSGHHVPEAGKFVLIPFFMVHYGLFCMVHGVFVFVLFNGSWPIEPGVMITAIPLVGSHIYSLITNYFGNGEYRRTNILALMGAPYARIIVLHFVILLGGFATMLLGSPLPALILLILLKTAIDLKMHLREHREVIHEKEEKEPAPVPMTFD